MPADAAPHAPLPFGDATNRPPPPADLSFLMSQKSGPVGGGGHAGWAPRGRAVGARMPARAPAPAGATPPPRTGAADEDAIETSDGEPRALAARSAIATRRTRAVVAARVRAARGGGFGMGSDHASLHAAAAGGAPEAPTAPLFLLLQRPLAAGSDAALDLTASSSGSDAGGDDADATVCLAEARRRAGGGGGGAAPKAAAGRRRRGPPPPPPAAPTPRRAAVQAQVAELNSLAASLLPGGTPATGAAAGRAADGTPLRERLARAWNGKSYYDRLVAEAAGGGKGEAGASAAPRGARAARTLSLTPPRAGGLPRVATLAPARPPLGGAAPPPAPRAPSPGRGGPAAAAAAARATGLAARLQESEAALASERARAAALEAELGALRRGAPGVRAPPAAALAALAARFARLRDEVDGAVADLERVARGG
jgi:DNA polymerase-3 subunit gamma/tau